MKNKIWIAVVSLFLYHSYVVSKIADIHTINSVFDYIESSTDLIIFDLDETLITLDHGEHWISEIYKQKNIADFEKIKYLYLWHVMHEEHRLVEDHSASLISQLQAKGHRVIALTARNTAPLIRYTAEQLFKLGIDFSCSGISSIDFVIEKFSPLARYYKGIIAVGSHNKGEVLMHVLQDLNIVPSRIIFVDDKLHHIQSVQHYALEYGISFVGLRYGRNDGKQVVLSPGDESQYYAWVEDIIV